MGNVLASSVPSPVIEPPSSNIPDPSLGAGVSKDSPNATQDSNPGTVEELHKACKGYFLNVFAPESLLNSKKNFTVFTSVIWFP